MTKELISATGIKRSFKIGKRKIEVLRGLDLSIAAQESVFLVGASGAGKTTLLYTLAGLEPPEEGVVKFDGKLIYTLNENARALVRNRNMGFIFQAYMLLSELTALENVLLPSMVAGIRGKQVGEALLERVGLKDRMHHLPSELSGGEQQRVAIARALVNDPTVVFADEPTGNLDSKSGEAIIDLLLALVRENQKTLVVVTHDLRLAERGDRRLEIADGLLKV